MPVGSTVAPPNVTPSVRGTLRLVFRARQGETYLAEQAASAPLKVLRPFALGQGRVLLQLVNVGPGVMGGDDYQLDITVTAGAKVVVVNQSATKLHRMLAGASARQTLVMNVEDGGELEYYPGVSIPYPEADFDQQIQVHLGQKARFGMLEPWAMGRIRRGEAFAFRRVVTRTRVSVGGQPFYADALDVQPSVRDASGLGLTDGYKYLASGVWFDGMSDVTDEEDNEEFDPRRQAAADCVVVKGGLEPHGLYLRALAQDGLTLTRKLRDAVYHWRTARQMTPVRFERFGA